MVAPRTNDRKKLSGLNSAKKLKDYLCTETQMVLVQEKEKLDAASRLCEETELKLIELRRKYESILNTEGGIDIQLMSSCASQVVELEEMLNHVRKEHKKIRKNYKKEQASLLRYQQEQLIFEKLIDKSKRRIEASYLEKEGKLSDELQLLKINKNQQG